MIFIGTKFANLSIIDMENKQTSSKMISKSKESGVIYIKRLLRNRILIGFSDGTLTLYKIIK